MAGARGGREGVKPALGLRLGNAFTSRVTPAGSASSKNPLLTPFLGWGVIGNTNVETLRDGRGFP